MTKGLRRALLAPFLGAVLLLGAPAATLRRRREARQRAGGQERRKPGDQNAGKDPNAGRPRQGPKAAASEGQDPNKDPKAGDGDAGKEPRARRPPKAPDKKGDAKDGKDGRRRLRQPLRPRRRPLRPRPVRPPRPLRLGHPPALLPLRLPRPRLVRRLRLLRPRRLRRLVRQPRRLLLAVRPAGRLDAVQHVRRPGRARARCARRLRDGQPLRRPAPTASCATGWATTASAGPAAAHIHAGRPGPERPARHRPPPRIQR